MKLFAKLFRDKEEGRNCVICEKEVHPDEPMVFSKQYAHLACYRAQIRFELANCLWVHDMCGQTLTIGELFDSVVPEIGKAEGFADLDIYHRKLS